jgi:hypothetical protein
MHDIHKKLAQPAASGEGGEGKKGGGSSGVSTFLREKYEKQLFELMKKKQELRLMKKKGIKIDEALLKDDPKVDPLKGDVSFPVFTCR